MGWKNYLGFLHVEVDKDLSDNKWNRGRLIFNQQQVIRGVLQILQITLHQKKVWAMSIQFVNVKLPTIDVY